MSAMVSRARYGASLMVHLHASGPLFPGDTGCRVECGKECGSRATTAYRNLDPERVTCPDCLARVQS